MVGKESRKYHKFLFQKPKADMSAEALAERLIEMEHVEEVLLTERNDGYLVRARFFNGKDGIEAEESLRKKFGGLFGAITRK